MPDDSRFVAESIEEMLVALANGVREAQEALSDAQPVDVFGRPMPTYHIPYLDFEIAVEIETQRQDNGKPVLRVVGKPAATGTSSSETRSTISGRLVAVPPGEGLPMAALRLAAEPAGSRRRRILVQLSNSAGELLAGQRVELNIDPTASQQLTSAADPTASAPRSGTRLAQAVLITDARGEAETEISLDPAEHARAVIVLAAQAGTTTARLSVTAGETA